MDNVQLTEQDLRDLNNGEEIIVTYDSIIDAMIGDINVIDLKISPPLPKI